MVAETNDKGPGPDLTGKVALVTGGGRGLGRAIALALARSGADVVLTYRERVADGAEVARAVEALGRKAALLQLDVAHTRGFAAFRDALGAELRARWDRGTFDALINNAGTDNRSPIAETTEEAFDGLMNVHFKGVYFLTQALLPLLADGGRVVNTSTGLARFVAPGFAAYASMKAAVEVFTRYLAKELGPRGVTANVVAPGPIETDFTRAAFEEHAGMKEHLAKQTALGRVGVPDDIGGVVAFLCSDAARWVTAQRIEASGGTFL